MMILRSMMPGLIMLFICAMTAARAAAAESDAPSRPAVLVELFTSQGCSSCPPADELLMRLSQAQIVKDVLIVPVAWHVNYWDHLGWKDPFSSPEATQRQQNYAAGFASDQIYTPQMVVDGAVGFVGSDRVRAMTEIAAAAGTPKGKVELTVASAKSDQGEVNVHWRVTRLPVNEQSNKTQVLLCITEDDLQTRVLRGENGGSTLQHIGVARRFQRLATIDDPKAPAEGTVRVPLDDAWQTKRLNVVVFIQESPGRRVLAVGSAPVVAQ